MPKGGGGGTQNTTVQPWSGSIPALTQGIGRAQSLFSQDRMAPQTFTGDRVADMNGYQRNGIYSTAMAANGLQPMLGGAAGATMGMIGAGNGIYGATNQGGMEGIDAVRADIARGGAANPNFEANTYRDLNAVKRSALGSVIPQVSSMFADSGGIDSSAAMDTISRAATEAVAPIEYGAYTDAQNREFAGRQAALGRGMEMAGQSGDYATRGLSLAPSIAGLQFMPGQQLGAAGGQLQGQQQAEIDGRMQGQYDRGNRDYDSLVRFMQLAQGTAGLGGTTTSPRGGPSVAGRIGGGLATGAGLYGGLAAAGAGGPVGVGIAGLAGLLGAFG